MGTQPNYRSGTLGHGLDVCLGASSQAKGLGFSWLRRLQLVAQEESREVLMRCSWVFRGEREAECGRWPNLEGDLDRYWDRMANG